MKKLNIKKLILIGFAMIFALCSNTYATDNIRIMLDGNQISAGFDPFIENGSTYLAARTVGDIVGADQVLWDAGGRCVILIIDGSQMQLYIGSDRVTIDGEVLYTGAVPIICNDRTYLPLRFVAEAFGAQVGWDGATRTVSISMSAMNTDYTDYQPEFVPQPDPQPEPVPESDADLYWLSRIVNAESANESYEGKLAVANVVLNRVKSASFPNTVYEVVFHKYNGNYQFTPAANGWILREPNEESVKAAQDALGGTNNVENCLYFVGAADAQSSWAGQNREFFAQIGNHAFYR